MSKSSDWSSRNVRKSKTKRSLHPAVIHVGPKENLMLLQYPDGADSPLRVNTRRRRRRTEEEEKKKKRSKERLHGKGCGCVCVGGKKEK